MSNSKTDSFFLNYNEVGSIVFIVGFRISLRVVAYEYAENVYNDTIHTVAERAPCVHIHFFLSFNMYSVHICIPI